jgi:hypothetical protein
MARARPGITFSSPSDNIAAVKRYPMDEGPYTLYIVTPGFPLRRWNEVGTFEDDHLSIAWDGAGRLGLSNPQRFAAEPGSEISQLHTSSSNPTWIRSCPKALTRNPSVILISCSGKRSIRDVCQ